MGFRINTNIAALNAQTNAAVTNRNLDSSLEKLSSGLRINKAADDASGMAIADSLRAQAGGLAQAVNNANDAIGIVQIADKAMDEQIKILDTIRTKATQSAQDGQSAESRSALQKDINKLMEELNNIASTTSYNGQNLLSGNFTNKSFQIGAYSNQTVEASIGSTSGAKIGHVRYESMSVMSGAATGGTVQMKFSVAGNTVSIESVKISTSGGTGIGVLADTINKNSDITGIRASYEVKDFSQNAVSAQNFSNVQINGVTIGNISSVQANDSDGRLVNAINKVKDQTGVEASVDSQGRLILTSSDGRGIQSSGLSAAGGGGIQSTTFGTLTLSRLDARDISFTASVTGGSGAIADDNAKSATLKLNDITAVITSAQAAAMGANSIDAANGIGAGLTSMRGAQAVIDITESAQKFLDTIRADLGSTQNQLVSTINNISVTQVNIKSAESQIRDVDFASESANFSKNQILAQSGSYAMSQANAIQQNVMKLLQ